MARPQGRHFGSAESAGREHDDKTRRNASAREARGAREAKEGRSVRGASAGREAPTGRGATTGGGAGTGLGRAVGMNRASDMGRSPGAGQASGAGRGFGASRSSGAGRTSGAKRASGAAQRLAEPGVRAMRKVAGPGEWEEAHAALEPQPLPADFDATGTWTVPATSPVVPSGSSASPDDTSMWLGIAASSGVSTGGTVASPSETATWLAIAARSEEQARSADASPLTPPPSASPAPARGGRASVDALSTSEWVRLGSSDAASREDTPADRDDESPSGIAGRAVRPGGEDAPEASRETPAELAGGSVVGRSAMLISLCVMISRITGFIRTWAMGFAMGTTLLSSSYQVACNLPNQLYELVMGGMLVTAFLPVYVSLRKREGEDRANRYASTLLGIVVVALGLVALLATVFAPQVVYTQMFLNPAGDRELVTYFFRFFAIQLLFYGVSAIVGGLLNARRDYFWSSAAPIANNLVVIAVMFVYVFIAPENPELGKLVIAVGTPLGVLTQMAVQIPALVRSGIRLRPRIDLRDPALRETLSLGVPTIIVTVASFVTVSVQNAAAMAVSDAGSSVLFYARQWFTLPYAFLSVPLTTTLFTELSDMAADRNREGMLRAIAASTRQNLFFMIPFALYLAVFSVPLVSLFCAGEFTQDSVDMVASYLSFMAISLPFYALFMFMQKVFSAIRRMRVYAILNLVVSAVQVVLTLLWCLGVEGAWAGWGINGVALAQTAFFVLGDIWCYAYLRRVFGRIELLSILRSALGSLGLGVVGAAVGGAALWALSTLVGPIGSSIPLALLYVVVGGVLALVATFGPAVALHVPEASFIRRILGRFVPALRG